MAKQRHSPQFRVTIFSARATILLLLVAVCGCHSSAPSSTAVIARARPTAPPAGTFLELKNPLLHAILEGNAGEISRLLAAGADPNVSEQGETALEWAAGCSPYYSTGPLADGTIVNLLLAHGAHVNGNVRKNGTALMTAAICRQVKNMRVLIAHGADVNARVPDGRTALFWAVTYSVDNTGAVRLLLSHHARVNTRDKYGLTPLGQAYRRYKQYPYPSFKQVIRLLKQAGAKT